MDPPPAAADVCPICHEIPIAPRSLVPCTHILCTLCAVNLIRHSEQETVRNACCPICRKMIMNTAPDSESEKRSIEALGEHSYKSGLAKLNEALVTAALGADTAPAATAAAAVLTPEFITRQQAVLDAEYAEDQQLYADAQRKLRRMQWLEMVCPTLAIFCGLSVICMATTYTPWGFINCVLAVVAFACYYVMSKISTTRHTYDRVRRPERAIFDPNTYQNVFRHHIMVARAHRHQQHRRQPLLPIGGDDIYEEAGRV